MNVEGTIQRPCDICGSEDLEYLLDRTERVRGKKQDYCWHVSIKVVGNADSSSSLHAHPKMF